MTLNQAMAAVNNTAAYLPGAVIDSPEWTNLFQVCSFFEALIIPHQPLIKRKYVFKIGKFYKTFWFPTAMTYLDVFAAVVRSHKGRMVNFVI